MMDADPAASGREHENARERDETPGERLDRQWSELLQELRVMQTGVQVLTGFLLTLPFQSRFADLGPELRLTFLVAASLATLATAFLVAPVVVHRVVFRRHRKDVLVDVGHVLAAIGLVLLALTVVTVVALIFGFAVSLAAGVVASVVAAAAFVGLWGVLPAIVQRRGRGGSYADRD